MNEEIIFPNMTKEMLAELASKIGNLPCGELMITNQSDDKWYCEMTESEKNDC